jgi:hypothetical protein
LEGSNEDPEINVGIMNSPMPDTKDSEYLESINKIQQHSWIPEKKFAGGKR